jgi:hypothetical protein
MARINATKREEEHRIDGEEHHEMKAGCPGQIIFIVPTPGPVNKKMEERSQRLLSTFGELK